MTLQIGGMVSGLDTKSLISQLMKLERRPINLLEEREKSYQVRLSGYGEIKSKLNAFQTTVEALSKADTFTSVKAVSSNEDVLTVSGSNTSTLGNHSIVVNGLAQAHAMKSTASLGSKDAPINTGVFNVNGTDITIDTSNNTLTDLAQAINAEDIDVNASVIDDGMGSFYLALTAEETGTANSISVTNDLGLGMVTSQAAQNSSLTVNGVAVQRSGNTIDDLIDGVTLTLHKTDADTVNVSVTKDMDSIKEKLNTFVDAYNAVIDEFGKQQTGSGEEGQRGPLGGDSAIRSIRYKLRRIMGDSVGGISGAYDTLAAIGIKADGKSGRFEIDDSKLTEALNGDIFNVITLFTADSGSSRGIATSLNDYLVDALDSNNGIIAAKEKGLQNSIDDLQDKQESMEVRLEKREANLWEQFNAMESLLSQYQATGNYLAMQLMSLNA